MVVLIRVVIIIPIYLEKMREKKAQSTLAAVKQANLQIIN